MRPKFFIDHCDILLKHNMINSVQVICLQIFRFKTKLHSFCHTLCIWSLFFLLYSKTTIFFHFEHFRFWTKHFFSSKLYIFITTNILQISYLLRLFCRTNLFIFHFLIWLHRQYWLHMNSHETSLNVVVLLTQRITL